MLTDHYPAAERDRFLDGLRGVDTRSRSRHGKPFVECVVEQRVALLTEMDEETYPPRGSDTATPAGDETWFFRRMKELTLVGYYTSEMGATRELHISPFGPYHGDIPYWSVGRSWA